MTWLVCDWGAQAAVTSQSSEPLLVMLRAGRGTDSTRGIDVSALERALVQVRKARLLRRHAGYPHGNMRPEVREARALWLLLHALGQVEDPSDAALAIHAKRVAYVDDMRTAGRLTMRWLIGTLKRRAMRALPDVVDGLLRTLDEAGDKGLLNAGRMQLRREADEALRASDGFHGYWLAWMALNEAFGIPFAAEIAELGVRRK